MFHPESPLPRPVTDDDGHEWLEVETLADLLDLVAELGGDGVVINVGGMGPEIETYDAYPNG